MKTIAVLGGSGFIGTRLCDRLIKRKDINFHVLDINKSIKYHERYKFCDVRDIDSLRSALAGVDVVINLAAEHKDNVRLQSKYYETNVEGQKNLCKVLNDLNISRLIFTSSVAVYGFVQVDTGEDGEFMPFHAYGDSKYKAEKVAEEWFEKGKQLSVVRPTVVFGEGNRGNVYNLLKQIASKKFVMIGQGTNCKSMAYVENIAAFIEHLIDHGVEHGVYNYVDKPDFTMNELVYEVNQALGKGGGKLKIPFTLGLLIGYAFDGLSKITGRDFPISSLRVKKFCSPTQFRTNTDYLGFKKVVTLRDGIHKTVKYEFGDK